ncbi:unnamed protein product [Citrullus colocynthis]|uniref:Uncharacterized protein n=1 Tax=Citrullus colocynthis TaxID=252529 RepID=A0ABP0Z3A9_9ROSI
MQMDARSTGDNVGLTTPYPSFSTTTNEPTDSPMQLDLAPDIDNPIAEAPTIFNDISIAIEASLHTFGQR